MQRALLYLAITACFLRSAFAEPSLKEAVKQQMSIFEQSKNKGLPTVYPELAQRLEAMFLRYPATHIAITGTSDKGRSETGHIYICGEDVYVTGAGEGENLIANNAGVFEWRMGHKEGVKISRNNKDLVDYLMYLTDASWIMASIYYDQLTSPGQFRVVPNNAKNWTLLEFKKPADGFEAIYVSQSPLWFYGMRMQNPQTGVRQEVFFSKPEETRGPPESFLQEFKKIKFENSNLTLRRHMAFL